MIDGLHPYRANKSSGIPWVGDIPAHWGVVLNQRIFKENIRPHGGVSEIPLSLSQVDGLIPTNQMKERSLQTSSYDNWKVTIPGDLVVNRFKAHLGVFFAATLRGMVSFHYGVFEPRIDLDSKYYELLYHTPAYRAIYAGQSNGMTVGLQNLSNQNFYNVRSVVPPRSEQRAIVRFLAHVDRRVRRFMRAKRQLIALLNEQKQAIIYRAVTRGLDPRVRLKSSGLDWLGDVPEHWEVVPSRALFTHRNEKAGPDDEVLTASQVHGIVSRKDFMAIEGRRVMQVIIGRQILKRVGVNDFVMSMRSFEGGLEWSQVDGAISSAYVMLTPTNDVHPPYYAKLLKTRAYISALRRTSDLVRDGQALRYANFLQVPLPRVPLEEQRRIAEELGDVSAKCNSAIQAIQRERTLVQEYHTRLISDVVTGKLDVTEAVAHLPEEEESAETSVGEQLDDGTVTEGVDFDLEPEEVDA